MSKSPTHSTSILKLLVHITPFLWCFLNMSQRPLMGSRDSSYTRPQCEDHQLKIITTEKACEYVQQCAPKITMTQWGQISIIFKIHVSTKQSNHEINTFYSCNFFLNSTGPTCTKEDVFESQICKLNVLDQ